MLGLWGILLPGPLLPRHPSIQHTADILNLLLEDIYIRYHFIFQALPVLFYENTCNVLYLIFYLLRIFLNILCENFLCFISYFPADILKPFLGEYSSPIHFFVTANVRTFFYEKYAPRFFFSETRTFSVKFISNGLYF